MTEIKRPKALLEVRFFKRYRLTIIIATSIVVSILVGVMLLFLILSIIKPGPKASSTGNGLPLKYSLVQHPEGVTPENFALYKKYTEEVKRKYYDLYNDKHVAIFAETIKNSLIEKFIEFTKLRIELKQTKNIGGTYYNYIFNEREKLCVTLYIMTHNTPSLNKNYSKLNERDILDVSYIEALNYYHDIYNLLKNFIKPSVNLNQSNNYFLSVLRTFSKVIWEPIGELIESIERTQEESYVVKEDLEKVMLGFIDKYKNISRNILNLSVYIIILDKYEELKECSDTIKVKIFSSIKQKMDSFENLDNLKGEIYRVFDILFEYKGENDNLIYNVLENLEISMEGIDNL